MKKRPFFLAVLSVLFVLALAPRWFAPDLARTQGPASDLLALINTARLSQGLHPYGPGREAHTATPEPASATGTAPPVPTATVELAASESEAAAPSLAVRLAPLAVGLQLIALVLGLCVALHRPEQDRDR